jgi:hypothetical protein
MTAGLETGATSQAEACILQIGPQPGHDALTRKRPPVSYRIQAFFWNPGGVGTGWVVRILRMGCGGGRVEEEANGSWVRDRQAGAERDFERAAGGNRIIHLGVRQQPGPAEA